jgi:hypothetical protein
MTKADKEMKNEDGVIWVILKLFSLGHNATLWVYELKILGGPIFQGDVIKLEGNIKREMGPEGNAASGTL